MCYPPPNPKPFFTQRCQWVSGHTVNSKSVPKSSLELSPSQEICNYLWQIEVIGAQLPPRHAWNVPQCVRSLCDTPRHWSDATLDAFDVTLEVFDVTLEESGRRALNGKGAEIVCECLRQLLFTFGQSASQAVRQQGFWSKYLSNQGSLCFQAYHHCCCGTHHSVKIWSIGSAGIVNMKSCCIALIAQWSESRHEMDEVCPLVKWARCNMYNFKF